MEKIQKLYEDDEIFESTKLGCVRKTKYFDIKNDREFIRFDCFAFTGEYLSILVDPADLKRVGERFYLDTLEEERLKDCPVSDN